MALAPRAPRDGSSPSARGKDAALADSTAADPTIKGSGGERKRLRPSDRKPLQIIDPHAARRIEHRPVLDLLGDDLEVQGAGELDHRRDHRLVDAVAWQVAHERAVDLQVIERQ